ncbi:UNKNOWN [Stylonychia lemnae]|uniref:Uncharacterized protein n=1 Tax=Stylonychia lemnae TaxID=5949 RepID=A0A078A189_STYLE|nr:UNKNOWN [Stylonychia lemnae]|eukprot:CDW75617.1 UNKNOWN [Stylonychia lemnae]
MKLSYKITVVTVLFFGISLTLSIERQIKLGLNFDGNLGLTLIFEEDQNNIVPEINLSTKMNQTTQTNDRTVEQNDININKTNLIHRDDDGQDQTQNVSLDHEQDVDSNINVGIHAGSNNNRTTTEVLQQATNGWDQTIGYMAASTKIFVKSQTDYNIFVSQKGQSDALQVHKDLYLNKVYKVLFTLMKRRELNDKIKQIYDQLLEYDDFDANDNQSL